MTQQIPYTLISLKYTQFYTAAAKNEAITRRINHTTC